MKIFLTNSFGYPGSKHVLAPTGLLYLAGILRKGGYEIKLYDTYLEKPTKEEFENEIKSFNPNIIGISCNAEDRLAGINTAKVAKNISPHSLVLLGGPFPTMCHEEIIKELDFVDIVVRHEGEETFREITDCLKEGRGFENVKGITYRKNGEIKINEDRPLIQNLNFLVMPNFDLIDIYRCKSYLPNEEEFENLDKISFKKQSLSEKPMASLIFGRGCPFNCLFCSAEAMWGRKTRLISPENAYKQVKYFTDRGVRDFVFQDDHLFTDKKWFYEFTDRIKELGPIRYACSSRIDALDNKTAQLIYRSGGRMITLGIENLNNHVLSLMNKRITVEKIWEVLEILRKNKIIVRGGILINTPGESLEEIKDNIKLHKKLRQYLVQSGTFISLRIYPGSPLEKLVKEKGRLNDFSWVKSYYNENNYFLGTPPHIPTYENFPSDFLLTYLVKESIKAKDKFLVRSFIRGHFIHLMDKEKRSLENKFKERLLVLKGIFQSFLEVSPKDFFFQLKFFIKAITQKSERVEDDSI